jgi:hypothetical protein
MRSNEIPHNPSKGPASGVPAAGNGVDVDSPGGVEVSDGAGDVEVGADSVGDAVASASGLAIAVSVASAVASLGVTDGSTGVPVCVASTVSVVSVAVMVVVGVDSVVGVEPVGDG